MNNLFDLTGRLALVTGAAKGLGRALALGLARNGAEIAALDTDPAVESLAAEIASLGCAVRTGCCDVTKEQEIGTFVGGCMEEFGRIDILINNAGINLKSPATEQTRANFEPVIEVNLVGVFLCCQAVGRVMLKQRRGSIINVSSIAGLAALGRGNNFYAATKAGIIALTKELALEWAPYRVRVNAIAPGWFGSERVTRYLRAQPGLLDEIEKTVPLGRLGDPAELIGPVVFLSSEASSMITGHVLVVDGGVLAGVPLRGASAGSTAP